MRAAQQLHAGNVRSSASHAATRSAQPAVSDGRPTRTVRMASVTRGSLLIRSTLRTDTSSLGDGALRNSCGSEDLDFMPGHGGDHSSPFPRWRATGRLPREERGLRALGDPPGMDDPER